MTELSDTDQQIVSNLRGTFGEKLAEYSDEDLLREYKEFSQSDMHGDNDERFPEWLDGEEPDGEEPDGEEPDEEGEQPE
jgi:hypothetical protein